MKLSWLFIELFFESGIKLVAYKMVKALN